MITISISKFILIIVCVLFITGVILSDLLNEIDPDKESIMLKILRRYK